MVQGFFGRNDWIKWFSDYKRMDMKIHLTMIDNYSFFLKNDRISDQISS